MSHNFDAKRIANLSSLHIDSEEAKAINDKIERVLASMDKMQKLDTNGIEPLINPIEHCAPLRDDKISEIDQREELQKLAPETNSGLYIVPQVISSQSE